MSASKEESVGERIKRYRLKKGLTQVELAALIDAPNAENIHRWETDSGLPQPRYRRSLAEVFDVPVDVLFSPQKEHEEVTATSPTQQTLTDDAMELSPIIGRDNDKEKLLKYIKYGELRVISLIGVGGIGKTRLAIEIKKELEKEAAYGVKYVSFASSAKGSPILPIIAVGLDEVPKRDTLEQVGDLLRGIHAPNVVLILDNFEHVLNSTALQDLQNLLTTVPNLKILLTSRTTLKAISEASFEQAYPLSPLISPTAEQIANITDNEDLLHYSAPSLFRHRVLSQNPFFPMSKEDSRTIAEICRRLGGLPLAINIAASWVLDIGIQGIYEKVVSGEILTMPSDNPDLKRQETLKQTFTWSYDLLGEEQQFFFRCMSIFEGGCSHEAAEFVFAVTAFNNGRPQYNEEPGRVDALIRDLRKHSMLEVVPDSGRLMMPPLVREYAFDLLITRKEASATQEMIRKEYVGASFTHAGFYATFLSKRVEMMSELTKSISELTIVKDFDLNTFNNICLEVDNICLEIDNETENIKEADRWFIRTGLILVDSVQNLRPHNLLSDFVNKLSDFCKAIVQYNRLSVQYNRLSYDWKHYGAN